MTLNEAIEHLKKDIPNIECKECQEEHIQLLNWLEILDILKPCFHTNETGDIQFDNLEFAIFSLDEQVDKIRKWLKDDELLK